MDVLFSDLFVVGLFCCRGARLRVESSGFGIQGVRTSRFGGFRDTRTTHRAWYIL